MIFKKYSKSLIIIFFLILSFVVFSELLLRTIGYLYLGKIFFANYNNQHPSPRNINILCLGESSTYGLWVNWEDSYPQQLKKKLIKYYKYPEINIIVPPDVGKNTSQISNRIKRDIKLFQPKLIIIMAGINNDWCLAESHISKYLNYNDLDKIRVKFSIFLSNFRFYRFLRYFFIKYLIKEEPQYIDGNKYYFLGAAENVHFPPEKFICRFGFNNKDAFIKMWRQDIENIIDESKKNHIKLVLMTYHINPTYLPNKEFVDMANKEDIPLVRNDKIFEILIKEGEIKNYLSRDNWHPNKQGYSIMANNVFECIKNNNLLGLKNRPFNK